jgi:hypothetical protein
MQMVHSALILEVRLNSFPKPAGMVNQYQSHNVSFVSGCM